MASGMPCASVSRLRLTPPLPRSVGLGPVFFPAQGRLGHGAIERQPRPVDPVECLQGQEPESPEFLEYASPRPLLKPPVGRTAGADTCAIERIPLRACAQHKKDRVHRRAITHPGVVASQRVGLSRGQ